MKRSLTYTALAAITLGSCLVQQASAQKIGTSGWTAETTVAPALANYGGNLYAAWKGWDGNHIWYSVGPYWESQQTVPSALTTKAPVLAAASNALYLAWRGQGTELTDKIYYSTNMGSGFAAQKTVCNTGGQCAETTASPAIAASGETVYVAYTTSSDTILLATYSGSGSWTLVSTPVPGATTTINPALTVYDGNLYLAWVEAGTKNLMYASMPLSGGSWSAASQVQGSDWVAQSNVAPAFGVDSVIDHVGLNIAWTAENANGTYTVNFSQFAEFGWNPPIPIPPGPLAVADVSPALFGYSYYSGECGTASTVAFDAAYTTTGDDIYVQVLQSDVHIVKCTCKGTTCL